MLARSQTIGAGLPPPTPMQNHKKSHDIETILIQHCGVPSAKPFQNIGVGRFRKWGGGVRFRILGEPMGSKSQQAHDVITTSN